MTLSRVEKERIADSRLKIQSVAKSLKLVDPKKIERYKEIQDCLEDTDRSLEGALKSTEPPAA